MIPPHEDFEAQPATKRDLAEVKKELKQDIGQLEETVKNGFENMEKLLGGPEGLIVRVKRVEEVVGIEPGA